MSAMRNAVPQRPYRERDQPQSRARLGLLEKHKDYSARAKDYNVKKARLKALRQKASARNEDEFNFGMMSSRTKDGVKIADRGNKALSHDVVKLLKTQDAGYLRTMRSHTMKERERLEHQILFSEGSRDGTSLAALSESNGAPPPRTRTVFVDNEAEQESFAGVSNDLLETEEQDINNPNERPRRQSAGNQISSSGVRSEDNDNFQRSRQRTLAKLEALRERERQLLEAERELDLQRAKMNNTTGGVNKHGVKFKVRERKK